MLCYKCNQQIADGSKFCSKCGAAFVVQPAAVQPNANKGDASDIFVPRSGAAIAAYYMGVFSFALPLLILPAIICGVIGIMHAKKHEGGRCKSIIIHSIVGIIGAIVALLIWICFIDTLLSLTAEIN